MVDRRRTWVAAIALAVVMSVPIARTAQAQEADLWAASVEDLTASPLQDDVVAELPEAVLEPAADGSISEGAAEDVAAPVRMEALARRAAAPTLSPNTGIFDGSVKVRCKSATRNSVIRYTTNGTTPTTRSPICRRGVTVKTTSTVKMRTFKAGMKPSRISSASVMIARPAVGDTQTFQVAWTPQTTLVSLAQLGMLISSDAPTRTYVINKQLAAAAGLDLSVGRVLILHGVDFGRILTSTVAGNAVTVTLGAAKLADAISDGVIAWDFAVPLSAARVKFVNPTTGAILAAQAAAPGSARAAAVMPITFKIGEYEYEVTANLLGSAADLTVVIKKDVLPPIGATYTMQAHLEGYRSTNSLQVAAGQLQSWNSGVDALKGDATLKLVVAGSGNLGYQPKFTIMKVPFLIGPIPASVDIGAMVVVNTLVPINGSASVETSFTYDSTMGLSHGGTLATFSGNLAGHTIGDPPAQPTAGGSSQLAANFGIGFPQIGFSVGAGIEGGVWFRPAFLIGATFTGSPIPLCVDANAQFLGAVGYDVSVFGFGCGVCSGDQQVFSFTKSLGQFGTCPP